ncbi:glycosyl transferase [Clostridium botulinum B2 433]|uniref:glycosyltransferase family 2 protein n=1 Tax=Clostridium botulinum TaxID=1491 RepID=UPI0007DEF013|nr:glycosyltransferase family A protein [Clostridium botulinum]KEI89854.1 glycosyl transferase [Clostridium botulinum B2 433]
MQLFSGENATSLTETAKDITGNLLNKNTNHIEQSESTDNMEIEKDTGLNNPPFISYVTFNRMGLTIRNLRNILDSDEDFEMHIIDCNSNDNSWDYIQSLNDKRIKSKTRFSMNYGPIYALNFNLAKRKPNQYFITIDSDTYIETKNWISCFMEVFEAFPEVGLLGVMRDTPYPRYMPPIIPRVKDDISYLELKNGAVSGYMDFIPGQLQCLRPELINEIGYWSEENGYGDAELTPRVVNYTSFKVGFLTTVEIDMIQSIGCDECQGKDLCKLSRSVNACYSFSKSLNCNKSFAKKFAWKYLETFKELEEGKRTAYCASIHDPESMGKHLYNQIWATENFNYYIKNSNVYRKQQ